MTQRKICVIANGYAEEMMAAKLMNEIRIELQSEGREHEFQFVGGSLVSSGKWYQEERFPTFFSGGMTPSGGFPTKSVSGFFADMFAGAFFTPFVFKNQIKKWSRYNLDIVVVVGDFLLMMLAVPSLKKKTGSIPMVFIPTAKSNYICPHYKIEKKFIKKYATMTFPRDQITQEDFAEAEINAICYGNLMQDLLDHQAPLIKSKDPVIALLPGSREESYMNLDMMLKIVPEVKKPIYWAFVQASSLDNDELVDIFESNSWEKAGAENGINVWSKGHNKIYCYPSSQFDSVALSCVLGISLAGTVGDQIAGLGKPVIGFVGTGPQSSVSRMKEYEKLLGDAFIYVKNYPMDVVDTINELLVYDAERERRGKVGIERMGSTGATQKIASYIVKNFLNN